MRIDELKAMNEVERILWFANARDRDLTIVLENKGFIKASKMKKSEKLSIIADLIVENNIDIEDEKIYKIMEDTKRLHEEISIRQSYDERIEGTLYMRYKNKEITYNELRNTCNKYNLDIPLSCNEECCVDFIDRFCHYLYSHYEHHTRSGRKYYSVLDKNYEWHNIFKNDGRYKYRSWKEKQYYENNTVDNGTLQLAFGFEIEFDWSYTLSVYKNYELLGIYNVNADIDDIERLIEYDDRLSYDDLDVYVELFEQLYKQRDKYERIIEADTMLRKKLDIHYIEFSSFVKENPKRVY